MVISAYVYISIMIIMKAVMHMYNLILKVKLKVRIMHQLKGQDLIIQDT